MESASSQHIIIINASTTLVLFFSVFIIQSFVLFAFLVTPPIL